MTSDLSFCRRRTLEHARRAVYSRDAKARAAFTRKAAIWAELALAVEINLVSLAPFGTPKAASIKKKPPGR